VEEFGDPSLKGFKVLHNAPLLQNTLLKIIPFAKNGIDIRVMSAGVVPHDPEAVQYLVQNKIPFLGTRTQLKSQAASLPTFDAALDTCAELQDLQTPHEPRMIVELTQSGSKRYEAEPARSIPVVSVDLGRVKFLEDHLGTANGFVRAYQQKVEPKIRGKHFVVWGYGKVGSGIVRGLLQEGAQCTVVDASIEALNRAASKGANCLMPGDAAGLLQVIKTADVLVTATGVVGCLSRSGVSRQISESRLLLANMGAEDEYGEAFAAERVLFNKIPLNFSLPEPTLLKYLDPVLYAHNRCVQLFAQGKLKPGFQALPKEEDDRIVEEWEKYWGEKIPDDLG